MGYIKNKVAEQVAKNMTERYGVSHVVVHNNRSGQDVVMIERDAIRFAKSYDRGKVTSVDAVYP